MILNFFVRSTTPPTIDLNCFTELLQDPVSATLFQLYLRVTLRKAKIQRIATVSDAFNRFSTRKPLEFTKESNLERERERERGRSGRKILHQLENATCMSQELTLEKASSSEKGMREGGRASQSPRWLHNARV